MLDITPLNHPLDPNRSSKNDISIEAPALTRCNNTTLSRENKETSIASSVIPWPYDDNKSMFLGLRACGFSFREACRGVGIGKSTVSNWRAEDADFVRIENDLPQYRKTLAKDYVELEFLRNFRLCLDLDYKKLQKAHGLILDKETGEPEELTRFDQDYVLKMRGQYTVDQMKALEAIVGQSQQFNFTEWIQKNANEIGMERTITTTEKITLKE